MTRSFKMGTNFRSITFLALIFFIKAVHSGDQKYTICGETGYKQRLDCITNKSDITTFGRVTYEEALSSPFSDKLYVLSEIHPQSGSSNIAEIEVVIVVKDANIHKFQDLKGAKVCYPGFKDSHTARYVISDFENTILKTISPDVCLIPNYPYIGKHVKGLSDFFSDSCRPGLWANHEETDIALKSTFSSLCKLCNESENYGCSTAHVSEPFHYSLDCFKNDGTVAILSKELALTLESPLYLTKNGTVKSEPYIWFRKPWEFVVSNKRKPEQLIELSNNNETTVHLKNPLRVDKYLTGINENQVKPKCNAQLNWCTNSGRETEECDVLKKVVSQQRIPVDIECVEKIDKLECINSVAQNETDILAAQNIYGYIARSKLLEPIAYPGVTVANATKSMVVILSEDNAITKFKDLKGKFGCFSQFGDIAFISFVTELQQQGIIKKSCSLNEFLTTFMGISCIPGIIDPNWETLPNTVDISTFCKCAGGPTSKTDVQCSASYENQYFANEGALKCLSDIGKYAVVSSYDIEKHLNDTKYSVLCKNNQKKYFSDVIKDDDDCFLSITNNLEIMIRKHDVSFIDALAMLSDLEELPKQFGIFDNLKNLIFQNSISKLYFKSDNDRFVTNYNKVFSNYDQCIEDKSTTNIAIDTVSKFYMYILPIITLYFCN